MTDLAAMVAWAIQRVSSRTLGAARAPGQGTAAAWETGTAAELDADQAAALALAVERRSRALAVHLEAASPEFRDLVAAVAADRARVGLGDQDE